MLKKRQSCGNMYFGTRFMARGVYHNFTTDVHAVHTMMPSELTLIPFLLTKNLHTNIKINSA